MLIRSRYGIGSLVYRARRPFDPLKLYRALEGKFVLLQDEADDEDEDEEMSDDAEHSDSASEDSEDTAIMDPSEILANKKACPLFRGLHRSKGIFWLATRPNQMGSWSTAGAMLTLGSEMPWFCTVSDDEWMADEDTMKSIKADFEGAWGDRRQELVLIGENLDVEGLTQMLDGCLLSRAEMRKWEGVMHDSKLSQDEKEEKLHEIWDDSYWAEWVQAEDEGHDHASHNHGH
jgi:G3E family GTPase